MSNVPMQRIRSAIENDDCNSPEKLGQAINRALTEKLNDDEYKYVLELVRNKLFKYQSVYNKLKAFLDSCKTIQELIDFTQDTDFHYYNARGVPVSKMITERFLELKTSQSFWKRIVSAFK